MVPVRTAVISLALVVLGVGLGFGQTVDPDMEVREFDRVVLKSGEEYTGQIYDETLLQFWIKLETGGAIQIQLENVERIDRRNEPPAAYKARKRALDEEDVSAQRALAEFCLEHDLQDEAILHLEAATELTPDDASLYSELLELYRQTPDVQKTPERRDAEVKTCSRGIRAEVVNVELHYRLVGLVELAGDRDMAIFLLRRMRDLPADAIADYETKITKDLVRLLIAEGRRDEAKQIAEENRETENQSELELVLVKARWALESFQAGDDGAAAEFEQQVEAAIALDKQHPEAYLLRGCYQLLTEDFEAAKGSFTSALSRGASGAPLDLSYALNFARQGSNKLARDLLERSRNVTSARELSKLIRAYLHENAGEGDVAWGLIQEAVSEEGASWQTWLVYLQSLTRYQPDTDIRPAAQHFLSMFGHNDIAFSECAILLGDDALDRGDADEARRWLAYAAETDGGDFELLLRLGCAHLSDGGDLLRARRALEQAQDIDAKNIHLRNALGCLEYRSGNLEIARRWFDGVVGEFPEREQEASEPSAPLAYALRGLRQVEGVLDEELWVDAFARPDGTVLNNWVDVQTFGVRISLQDGRVVFDGTQQFESDGLTILYRTLDPEKLSRFRCRVKLTEGADKVRLALRFEDKDATEGIVFFRDLDGVMAFAENGRDGFEEHRPPEPKDESSDDAIDGGGDGGENGDGESTTDDDVETDPFDMKRVVWENDGEWHLLEIRLDPSASGQAELYFDGVRVARKVKVPGRSRGGLRCGISGQASMGAKYRFEVDDFEIFRKRPKNGESNRR